MVISETLELTRRFWLSLRQVVEQNMFSSINLSWLKVIWLFNKRAEKCDEISTQSNIR